MTEQHRDRLPAGGGHDELEQLFQPLREARHGFSAGFRARVMRRVREPSLSPVARFLNWITTPRTLVIRPVTAAVAVAAVVTLMVVGTGRETAPSPAPDPVIAGTEGVPVEFILLAPEASSVAVTGDFVGWDPDGVTMQRREGGRWVAQLRVSPGVHHYVFVVDGAEWRSDPNATAQVDDGFGQQNSVLLVPDAVSS